MNRDYYTVSDGSSITFVERVQWSNARDTGAELELLRNYRIVHHMVTVSGFLMILQNMDPMEFNQDAKAFKVARFAVNDETGRVEVHSMNVTAGQVAQLLRAGEWFE